MHLGFAWLFLFLLGAVGAPGSRRSKFNFNPGWKVLVGEADGAEDPSYDDADWKDVTLPYAWNEDDAFDRDIYNLSTGVAWYRKTFRVPESAKGQKFFLEFEGIRQGGELYLNGEWIGRSGNGVMAFGFDVTELVKHRADNVVAAMVNSSWDYVEVETGVRYQWQDRNFYANYGGINKNVYLHATDLLHQTLPIYSNLGTLGPYVYATDINVKGKSATIVAETQVKNDYSKSKKFRYSVDIIDAKGKTVKKLQGKEKSIGANETQAVSLSAQIDDVHFWSWGYGYLYDVKTTLSLDGKVVDSVTTRTGFRKTSFDKGMFQLNDRTLQLKGYAQRTTNEWPALGSSVPAWLSDFSNRLVLESNGNLIRWMHVTPWKQDVESLDRLGLIQALPAGDAESDTTDRKWEQRVEVMRDAIIYNRNNPSVIFYESGNEAISEEHMAEMKALRDKYDPYGGRAAGSREMLSSTVAEYGGEMLYINKGSRFPFWSMEYSRDEGHRKYWDDFSPPYHQDGEGEGQGPSYNRNQDSHAIENVVRWHEYYEMRPGTGERVNSGGVNIIFSDSNTHYRGSENYRRSGEVDAVRLPKDGWYAHQVMWDNWVDVDRHAAHIVGHWNYAANVTKNITVISSADKVELFRNGESLGFGDQTYKYLFTFPDIAFEAGEIKAVGYDADGESETASDVRETVGEPAAIRLTSHVSPAGLKATGADIALVDVEVVDASGRRCPTALNMIEFELSGEAEWRGGIAIGDDTNYILSKSLPVENGVNRVMLRPTTKAGKITLKAVSDGLKSATVELRSSPQKVKDGLTLELPSAGLKPNYSRGPTPKGESFTVKRKTLKVASTEAGSNLNSTSYSLDDDELTTWSSASGHSNARISYLLEESAVVSQIVLKMSGFRTTQYNMSVLVDGQEQWTGLTPLNLGYVTLTFDEAEGSNVTLASNSNSALKITEAEIYGPL